MKEAIVRSIGVIVILGTIAVAIFGAIHELS